MVGRLMGVRRAEENIELLYCNISIELTNDAMDDISIELKNNYHHLYSLNVAQEEK